MCRHGAILSGTGQISGELKMGEKNWLSLEETQQAFYEMLVEFDQICKRHGLRYDLCGGTMLGAVRHRGFIPWDDDIDVSMPRPDYEKLRHSQNRFQQHRGSTIFQSGSLRHRRDSCRR